jgi:hypothetical protein
MMTMATTITNSSVDTTAVSILLVLVIDMPFPLKPYLS